MYSITWFAQKTSCAPHLYFLINTVIHLLNLNGWTFLSNLKVLLLLKWKMENRACLTMIPKFFLTLPYHWPL